MQPRDHFEDREENGRRLTRPAYPADPAVIDPNRGSVTPCPKRQRPRGLPPSRPWKLWMTEHHRTRSVSHNTILSQHRRCLFGERESLVRTARRGSNMLAQQFHEAVAAARSRAGLDDISRLVWRALAEGHLNEIDAEVISAAVEARRAAIRSYVPKNGDRPSTKPAGGLARAHCRSPDRERSIRRRRAWVASGWLPPSIAARFTPAEAAALAVVAEEVRKRGRCEFPLDRIAAVAGVSRSSVRNAIRSARLLGLVSVMERRHRGARSETNVIAIVSAEWAEWLRLGEKRRVGWGQNREHHDSEYLRRNESRISKRKAVDAGSVNLWRNWSRDTICSPAADRRLSFSDRQLPSSS